MSIENPLHPGDYPLSSNEIKESLWLQNQWTFAICNAPDALTPKGVSKMRPSYVYQRGNTSWEIFSHFRKHDSSLRIVRTTTEQGKQNIEEVALNAEENGALNFTLSYKQTNLSLGRVRFSVTNSKLALTKNQELLSDFIFSTPMIEIKEPATSEELEIADPDSYFQTDVFVPENKKLSDMLIIKDIPVVQSLRSLRN